MVKTALPCNLAIAQKFNSKLLYLVGFHFKTLRDVKTVPKHQPNRRRGLRNHGGLLPTWSWSATAFSHVTYNIC